MKPYFIGLFTVMSLNAFAAPAKLAPCDARGLKSLVDSIADAKKDGYPNVKMMKNVSGQTVGYYAWGKEKTAMSSEVCEYLETDEMVTASKWFYWESLGKPDPSSWTINGSYSMRQDEGGADIDMLKANKKGNVTVAITILGMGEDDLVPVRKDVVTFSDK